MVLRRSDMEEAPAFVPPGSKTEQTLAEIWQTSIGIDMVGIHDDFFLVCGSSLVAAMIFSRVHEVLGVKLPLSLWVSARNVEQLARHIDQLKPQG